MPKIIIFTKYAELGASSRMRFYQYLYNIDREILTFPLFENEYLRQIYSGNNGKLIALKNYARRMKKLILCDFKNSTIVIEKELFPYIPYFIERIFLLRFKSYILDYDDATFHTYDNHNNLIIKLLLKNKISKLMYRAEKVVCGNEYLAAYANLYNKKVQVVPTVVDCSRLHRRKKLPNKKLLVGWIGTPKTQKYLEPVYDVVAKLSNEFQIQLVAVGAKGFKPQTNFYREVVWVEDCENEIINSFDVGVMPLIDEPFERGKCGFKLLQYMAVGLPVIASSVGVNSKIIDHEINGFLAFNNADWELLINNFMHLTQSEKFELGSAGRLKIENNYNLHTWKLLFDKQIYG
ncbi:glycosyltransferase family 4 protein [Amylibacter sp.]|nr:glycosyltransferase family 4 protein [Amylibacter sp.]